MAPAAKNSNFIWAAALGLALSGILTTDGRGQESAPPPPVPEGQAQPQPAPQQQPAVADQGAGAVGAALDYLFNRKPAEGSAAEQIGRTAGIVGDRALAQDAADSPA